MDGPCRVETLVVLYELDDRLGHAAHEVVFPEEPFEAIGERIHNIEVKGSYGVGKRPLPHCVEELEEV